MNQLLLGHLASAWRLDKTIMRKWAPNIQEKISRETRSPYFIKALEFLKNMNDNKHLNERVHQKVRSVALANFDSQLKFYNSMPIEQIMHWMRTLLMFQKCESLNRNQSILFNNAFQTMPAELSRFSEDDIVEINRMIEDISGGWMTCAPNIRLSYSQKRSRKTVVEEPEQKGIPNRRSFGAYMADIASYVASNYEKRLIAINFGAFAKLKMGNSQMHVGNGYKTYN
uniref:Uncharacterized protein n=1 Tax=Caenorhabditis japonica TaxID=281687 RepID=A0A8R1IE67_CAEJA